MVIMSSIFWVCVGLIVYVYFGYPFCVWFLGKIYYAKIQKSEIYPFITVITAAHNEALCIEETIRNKFEQDYPLEKIEYIVVSDASNDGTDEIVRKMQKEFPALVFIRLDVREGKTVALNHAINYIRSRTVDVISEDDHILVLSDANSIYKKDAIKKLAENFSDQTVGYVTGKMVYVTNKDGAISEGCGAYMKYENALREWESRIGSIVGVDGGIDAVREKIYEEMDAMDLPDFVLPLTVVEKGYRVVYEKRALLQEEALQSHQAEFSMRVRVALRSYYCLLKKRSLLNVFKYSLFSIQLLSHKVFRYSVGTFQICAFIANIILVTRGSYYAYFMMAQGLFYGLAFIGCFLAKKTKGNALFYFPYYMCLLNYAAFIAFLKLLRHDTATVWKPRRG